MYLSWEKNYSNQNVGTERFFFKFPLSYVKKALNIYYQTKHYNDNIHWQASFEPLYVSKRHQRQIVVIYKKLFTMWGKKNNNRSEKKGVKDMKQKKIQLTFWANVFVRFRCSRTTVYLHIGLCFPSSLTHAVKQLSVNFPQIWECQPKIGRSHFKLRLFRAHGA